jgi:hypothetical protein
MREGDEIEIKIRVRVRGEPKNVNAPPALKSGELSWQPQFAWCKLAVVYAVF